MEWIIGEDADCMYCKNERDDGSIIVEMVFTEGHPKAPAFGYRYTAWFASGNCSILFSDDGDNLLSVEDAWKLFAAESKYDAWEYAILQKQRKQAYEERCKSNTS